jgi:hypothetical protein
VQVLGRQDLAGLAEVHHHYPVDILAPERVGTFVSYLASPASTGIENIAN